ncbi:Hsp70 protein [Pseudoduganella flava]|uniref:Hsp70 family protein n=1 Tax=Pseudoduganella flava TaxID=871742 RepID=A0A562PEX7_9BURK|nr:Hsp70 family protein [Pseudoduganella flava]QGZ38907.1 Hsp70 family protein [Pseudoduganella flava]TWI42981.1 Hsp70 protein [Pseudoduganella flava]
MTPYLVGIDLGTTNTVLAYAAPGSTEVRLFDIEQLTAPGEVHGALLLPSARYHPAPGELAPGELQLPWPRGDEDVVIGRLARTLGAQVPGRLVTSAKSWLSHPGVDRTAPILPWGADEGVPKVSPVAASASYLAHLRDAWNARFPSHPLERQQVVLTIPASFDEGARALTLEAAKLAGLGTLRLLEEPQAALYDWLYRHRANLAGELADTRLVLVADVGGGTTDFSLVQVTVEHGEPVLERIGVGNHLILGGDNMDLALAHLAETRLGPPDGQQRLSAGRLAQLTERCRAAKEQLLDPNGPEQATVTLLGSGSKLIGGSRSVTLTRADVAQVVVDGFFPLNAERLDARRARAGIVEFGLPYASDPAVTRHLAGFLRQHAQAARAALGTDAELPVPDTLLLNGGVFRAGALAQRLTDTLAGWRKEEVPRSPRVLHNDNPDVAVARGAVAYALSRQGLAPSIAGGSARSYYLLLDGDKSPGVARRAVCILPRGAQPGREVTLADRTFALRLGRPVRFHLVSTVADLRHGAGDLADLDPADFVALPPIATVLESDVRKEIPVRLATALSEVGTLEVHCVDEASGRRWLLEFQLRGEDDTAQPDEEPPPPRFPDAVEKIDRIFGTRALQVDSREVRQLRGQLEHLLGSRERWSTPLLRRLFDALMQRAKGRRRSPEHERVWLNLAGWCLRPGFGAPLDDWRIGQLWALFEAGAQYFKDSQVRAEWWTLWRRVAGGLATDAQLRLLDDFAFNLQADAAERGKRPATLVDGSEEDMLRLGASLERIPSAYKAEIGNWMVGTIVKLPTSGPKFDAKAAASFTRYLWALGRVGARQPFHGSAHEVAPVAAVEAWLAAILKLDWKKIEPAGFAAAHLARMTGDRSRDIDPVLRDEVLRRLAAANAPPTWSAMVRDVVELDQASEQRMFGDALPPGLKLIS